MKTIKIALFSFADINNYGDILFSWVIRHELQKRLDNVHFDFYSPSDCNIAGEEYIAYTRERVDNNYDALILIGGEVVHFFDARTWDPIYTKRGLTPVTGKASDIVWDWPTNCTAPYKAWLSVGVRPFEDENHPEIVEATLEALNQVSVRGVLSKKLLENTQWLHNDNRITISPDLGWAFPRIQPEQPSNNDKKPYALFQFHNIDEDEAEKIAASLLRFHEKTGLEIYLMPVIHLWNDHEYMQRICDAAPDKFVMLDNNLDPMAMLDFICHAELVLASSLHVVITALAFGHPGAVLNKWSGTKFQDLMGMQMRPHAFINSVADVDNTLDALHRETADSAPLLALRNFMSASLDSALDKIAEDINNAAI